MPSEAPVFVLHGSYRLQTAMAADPAVSFPRPQISGLRSTLSKTAAAVTDRSSCKGAAESRSTRNISADRFSRSKRAASLARVGFQFSRMDAAAVKEDGVGCRIAVPGFDVLRL